LSILTWIIGSGLLMSAIALVGGITTIVAEETLRKFLLPLVALAAGSMLGGALFHLLPMSIDRLGNHTGVYLALICGFVVFFVLEQFLHWHHCHAVTSEHKQPLGYLVLVADGLHNFIGGLAVGGAFLIDIGAGITAWTAAAAHEIPQELGDFGALVHGGWEPRKALGFNFLSALTFPLGGVLAYGASQTVDVAYLVPFAAGNFVYIGAADLIPEVKEHEDWKVNVLHLIALLSGLGLMLAVRWVMH
jgi:zinc and cadmium transporter